MLQVWNFGFRAAGDGLVLNADCTMFRDACHLMASELREWANTIETPAAHAETPVPKNDLLDAAVWFEAAKHLPPQPLNRVIHGFRFWITPEQVNTH